MHDDSSFATSNVNSYDATNAIVDNCVQSRITFEVLLTSLFAFEKFWCLALKFTVIGH
jgi:hypothetical protein